MAKVLIIDDDYDLRTLVCDLLTAHHFEAVVAANGPAGLECARTEKPDLIILDVSMPGMDGFAVVRALRDIPEVAGAPIIAFTAHALRGDRERVLAGGYDGYIAKPFQPADLLKTVQQFLNQGRKAA